MANQGFKKGEIVEVRSEEEGFKGSWYKAKIIGGPVDDKFVVEYTDLLECEETKKLLIETVDVSFVRPLPPETGDEVIEVNDVVDALLRDGWWTGVVSQRFEGSTNFVVYFENPPDEVVLCRSDLRLHYDWVGGKWRKPQKKSVSDVMLSKGTAVEVSFKTENYSIWHLGTVLQVTEEDTIVLLEYKCPGGGKKTVTEDFLKSPGLRPSPPRLEDKELLLLEEVDVYYDFCWWVGVIRRRLEGRRYVVLLKHANVEMEFDHSQLRPHMIWTDGKWATSSKDAKTPAMLTRQSVSSNRNQRRARKQQAGRYCTSTGKNNPGVHVEDIVEKECIAEEVNMSVKESCGAQFSKTYEAPEKKEQSKDQYIHIADRIDGSTERDSIRRRKRGEPEWFQRKQTETPEKKDQKEQSEDQDIHIADRIDRSTEGDSSRKRKKGGPKLVQRKQTGEGDIEAECSSGERVVKDSCVTNEGGPSTGNDRLILTTFDDKPNEDLSQPSTGENRMIMTADKELLSGLRRHNKLLKETENISLADDYRDETFARKGLKRPKNSLLNEREEMSKYVDNDSRCQDCEDTVRGTTSDSHETHCEKIDDEIQMLVDEIIGDMNDNQPLSLWIKEKPIPMVTDDSRVFIAQNQCTNANSRRDDSGTPLAVVNGNSLEPSALENMISADPNSGDIHITNFNQCAYSNGDGGELGTPVAVVSSALVSSNSAKSDQSLPFVKCSPIWKCVESMEIFQKTPQKPHFSPLFKYKEETREGLAIGHMVTFSNVLEGSSKLKFSDPSTVIERKLETLAALEPYGFDVGAVRSSLTELLSKKEKAQELQGMHKAITNEISNSLLEKAEVEQKLDQMYQKIREHAEKCREATSEKYKKENEISKLQSKQNVVHEEFQRLQLDYEGIVRSLC